MESLSRHRKQLQALRYGVQRQVNGLEALGKAFAQEGERLGRHDKAWRLRELKADVMGQVAHLLDREAAAEASFHKANLTIGLAKFAFGSMLAVAKNSQEHPLLVGARLGASEVRKEAPFRSVVIAVTPEAVEDVKVISVSQLARDWGSSESYVKTAIKKDGRLLFTPENFYLVLDRLEYELIGGSMAVPAVNAKLMPRIGGLTQQPK